MPTKYLTPRERKERADRNRLNGTPGGRAPKDEAKKPLLPEIKEGSPLHTALNVLDKLDSVPHYAGGEELTPVQVAAMCAVIEVGNFPHHVAEAMGIPEGTWKTWMLKGRQGHPTFGPIYQAISAARRRGIISLAAHLRLAAESGTWAAAARMLESLASTDWMRTEKVVDETSSRFLEVLSRLEDMRKKAIPAETRPIVVETTAAPQS